MPENTEQSLIVLDRERSRLQDELNTLIRWYRLLVGNIPHPLFVVDYEGNYLHVYNPGAIEQLGARITAGKTIFDKMPPAAAQERLELVQLAISENETVKQEFSMYYPYLKETRDYEASIVPDQNIALVVIVDVTEEKRKAKAARDNITKLKADLDESLTELHELKEVYAQTSHAAIFKRIEDIFRRNG